ncbi:hypothetical protein [uncultured Sphingomonas sp.]|uniref:hypothetical protein n=1 Tax=uncultured Sphingomonas sp. TaxID=158754 RepID=UPI0035C9F561
MNWPVLGGSLAAILVLAGICWALKLGRVERIASPEDAADAADQSLPGFDTVGAVVGADGSGALAVADDGRVAVMKRHGARIAVREVTWHALRSTPAGIVVETGERRFGSVSLTGVDALDIRRLAPQLTRV